ncbi:MAG TPA: hypothetical protein VGH66_03235, partial [Acidimicrobiales bacterium]
MVDTAALPRWDLSGLFPSLDSREFTASTEALGADLARLTALYDRHDVRAGAPSDPTPADVAAFDEVVHATNALLDQVRTLSAYVAALVSTDAGNDQAATVQSRLQAELAGLQKLTTRFEAWVARFGAEALVEATPVAADHAHALEQADRSAAHQMSEAEESLFAELRLTGSSAWNKLHGDVTARLTGSLDGETLPITVIRGLATHGDGGIRQRAFVAELTAWESVAVTLAACLNAIKGEANTVNRRRGWAGSLEPAL